MHGLHAHIMPFYRTSASGDFGMGVREGPGMGGYWETTVLSALSFTPVFVPVG